MEQDVTREDADRALEVVAKLLVRANEIVESPPYWKGVYTEDCCKLTIEGDTANLTWWEASSYYDSCTMEAETCEFPANLLFLGEQEFSYWKAEEKRIYNAQQVRRQQENLAAQEAKERAAYEALKAKYGR